MDWQSKLDAAAKLQDGWNSYDAPAPSAVAIQSAKAWLLGSAIEPDRVAPAAIGGIGITYRGPYQRVYVEFRNDRQQWFVVYGQWDNEPTIKRLGSTLGEAMDLAEMIRAITGEPITRN